jgi:hypothetical protein
VIRSIIRISAFVRKEIVDAVRQPLLLLALVVGPFLILLVFGAGLRETDPQLRALLVAPEETDIREQVEELRPGGAGGGTAAHRGGDLQRGGGTPSVALRRGRPGDRVPGRRR